VHHWYYQLYVPHTLTAYFFLRHLHTATVTNDAFVADTLVLATVAFIIFYRTKNTLAEQAIPLRFVGAIVDGFRFQHFPVAPLQNIVWRGKADGN
jgi:hypothetical protein